MHYMDQQSFRMTEDLLKSGSFESEASGLRGWARDVSARPAFSAAADIVNDSRAEKSCDLLHGRRIMRRRER